MEMEKYFNEILFYAISYKSGTPKIMNINETKFSDFYCISLYCEFLMSQNVN